MDEKVQLSKETIVGNDKVETDIFPNTNTNSVINTRNGLNMSETIEAIWAAINNKLSRVVNSVNGRTGVVVLDASDVGLENVDNVSFNDIKQWVIEELGDEFDNKHLRIYDSLSDLNLELNNNDLDLKNSPFIIKRLTDADTRSYIGYLTTDAGGDHLQSIQVPLNTIGKTDDSIRYNDGSYTGTSGNIHVKISSTEDALKLFPVTQHTSEAERGLYIDKSKFAGHMYFFDGVYGDETDLSTALINPVHISSDTMDKPCSIYIDGELVAEEEWFHQADVMFKNDLIMCNFKDYRAKIPNNGTRWVLNARKTHIMLDTFMDNGNYQLNDIVELQGTPHGEKIKFIITGIRDQRENDPIVSGSVVTIEPGAVYSDGTEVPPEVYSKRWIVSVDDDEYTLTRNTNNSESLNKKISIDYLHHEVVRFVTSVELLYCDPVPTSNKFTGTFETKPIIHPYPHEFDPHQYTVASGLTISIIEADDIWTISKYSYNNGYNTALMNRGFCIGKLTSQGVDVTGNPGDVWRIDFYTTKQLLGSGLQYKTSKNLHDGLTSIMDIKLRQGHFRQFGSRDHIWDVSGLCVIEDWGKNRDDNLPADAVSGSGNTVYNPGRNKRYAVTPSGVVDLMINEQSSSGGLSIMTDLSMCIQPHYIYDTFPYENGDRNSGSYAVDNWCGVFPTHTILNDPNPPSYLGINLLKSVSTNPQRENLSVYTYNESNYIARDHYMNLSGLRVLGKDTKVNKALLGKSSEDKYFADGTDEHLIDGIRTSGGLQINVGKGLEINPSDIISQFEYYDGGKVELRVDKSSFAFDNNNRLILKTNDVVYHDIDIFGNYHPVYNVFAIKNNAGESISPSVYVNTRHGLGVTISGEAPPAVEVKIKAMTNGNSYKYRNYTTGTATDALMFDPDGILISPIDTNKGLINTYRAEVVSVNEYGDATIREIGGLAINVGTGLAFDADGKLYATGETEHNIIDEELSPDSTHAVQNKAIYNAINAIGNPIATVEENSEKSVQSKGIYEWTVDLMSKTDGKFYGTFDSKTALDAAQDPKAKNDYAYVKGETSEGDATQGRVKGLNVEQGGYLKLHATDTNDPTDPDIGNRGINQNGMILPILATGTYCYKVKFNNIEGWANKEYIDLITEETQYVRYKFTGTQWKKEFVLNNTSFTTEQLNAINSTITAEVVTQVKAHLLDTTSNPHQVTKTMVGLGNVDNTSDLDKPISTAATTKFTELETSINGKQDASCRQLESGTDLDECTIVSNFACDTAEIGATLLNLPNVSNIGNGPLRLEVKSLLSSASTSSTTNVIQTLYPSALPGKMYIRYCVADTWGNWFEFAGAEISSS